MTKLRTLLITTIFISAPFLYGNELSEEEMEVLTTYGYMIGKNAGMHMNYADDEIEHIMNGIKKAANKDEEPQDYKKLIQKAHTYVEAKFKAFQLLEREKRLEEAKPNIEIGIEFFKNLDEKPDIKKTASGLRYKILNEGTAEMPYGENRVKINYHGTLIDGTVFDSSVEREKPVTLAINKVIPGFREGLQLIGKGGKIKLYIPYNLGYGINTSKVIPAGSTLIFDIDMLDVIREPADEATK